MLQDPSGVVDYTVGDPPGGEDPVYLSRGATSEPWSGTDEIFGVLREVVFDWDDNFFGKSFGFCLAVILPDRER